MSKSVSAATLTAVSASISTPVRSVVRTDAVSPTSLSPIEKSTSMPVRASGWHNGMRSLVRLAASTPATRAVARASPLGSPPEVISATTSAVVCTVPAATAVRAVAALSVTSTMCAAPCSSRCERRRCGPLVTAIG